MKEAVHLLKALADPTRLRIVLLLQGRDELCVCEIVDALDIPQYSVSRHLSVLKAAGIVADWRQGKWMHYALDPGMSDTDRALLDAVSERAAKELAPRRDRRRLAQHLRPRVGGDVVECET